MNREDGRNKNAESDFLEGQVISCLQQIFLKNEKDLYPECKRKNNYYNRGSEVIIIILNVIFDLVGPIMYTYISSLRRTHVHYPKISFGL